MTSYNNIKSTRTIWKDDKKIELLLLIIPLSLAIIIALVLLYTPSEGFVIDLGLLIIVVLSIYQFLRQTKRRLALIKSNGLQVGNVTLRQWKGLGAELTAPFSEWTKIRDIKLVNKVLPTPKFGVLRTFMYVRTKYGEKYECVLYDYNGFISALRKLRKGNLLSKRNNDEN